MPSIHLISVVNTVVTELRIVASETVSFNSWDFGGNHSSKSSRKRIEHNKRAVDLEFLGQRIHVGGEVRFCFGGERGIKIVVRIVEGKANLQNQTISIVLQFNSRRGTWMGDLPF